MILIKILLISFLKRYITIENIIFDIVLQNQVLCESNRIFEDKDYSNLIF